MAVAEVCEVVVLLSSSIVMSSKGLFAVVVVVVVGEAVRVDGSLRLVGDDTKNDDDDGNNGNEEEAAIATSTVVVVPLLDFCLCLKLPKKEEERLTSFGSPCLRLLLLPLSLPLLLPLVWLFVAPLLGGEDDVDFLFLNSFILNTNTPTR